MEELTASVKAKGVIEPVLVRMVTGEVPYELVAGERRWRAASAVASENGGPENYRIPALVRSLTDDDAFDLMMVENLQREDLNELEEAEGFETYLKRKGKPALAELAERTGFSERYIRKRLAVLKLPKEVLKLWQDEELTYSHLEQFLRIRDDKALLDEMVMNAVEWGETARDLKDSIDSMSPWLSKAVFDTTAAGCGTCSRNSDVQRQLFDLGSDGKKCLDPACFKNQLKNYLLAHWEDSQYFKDFGTAGFRFDDQLQWKEYVRFYDHERGPWKACRSCEHFVTMIDDVGRVDWKTVCLDPVCYKKRRGGGDRKKEADGGGKPSNADPAAPKVAWHGEHFREKFYQASIPERFFERIKTSLDNPEAAEIRKRLALFALLKLNTDLHAWLAGRLGIEVDENEYWYRMSDAELFGHLEKMDFGQLLETADAATLETVMQREFGSDGRRLVADHIGIDLESEFRIDDEYLQKKTKAEIIAIGEHFGVFEQKCVQDFLFETLLKKRGKYKSCKKGDLIRLFLESGADLAGVVPAEILGE